MIGDRLRAHALFAGVDDETVEQARHAGRAVRVDAGELLIEEGSEELAFFILFEGSVKVFYHAPEGTEVVVKLFRAPAAFGEIECLTQIPYLENVRTIEPSYVFRIDRSALFELLESSHRLAMNVLLDVSARFCISAQYERSLAFHSVETRLANLMQTYAEFYGRNDGTATIIETPLTQDDLANALGVARRSVTRALKTWTEAGLIEKRGKHFVILDAEGLERFTDPSLLRIGYKIGALARK